MMENTEFENSEFDIEQKSEAEIIREVAEEEGLTEEEVKEIWEQFKGTAMQKYKSVLNRAKNGTNKKRKAKKAKNRKKAQKQSKKRNR